MSGNAGSLCRHKQTTVPLVFAAPTVCENSIGGRHPGVHNAVNHFVIQISTTNTQQMHQYYRHHTLHVLFWDASTSRVILHPLHPASLILVLVMLSTLCITAPFAIKYKASFHDPMVCTSSSRTSYQDITKRITLH